MPKGEPPVHSAADIADALRSSSPYVRSESNTKPSSSASAAAPAASGGRHPTIPASATGAGFPSPSPLLAAAAAAPPSAANPSGDAGSTPGAASLARYSHADSSKARELRGTAEFRIVWNNGLPEHMIALIGAKDIFAAQLPNMPKEYVTRHVLDRNHRTMVIVTERGVIGGICFRPFFSQRFAEIVFCAITSTEQVKGYGSRIMNHLKEHVKTEGIEYFLTYADNYATEYFRKQGFTKLLSLSVERWKGWIKDYDGSTLMECKINKKVNYLDVPGMVAAQKEAVFSRIKQVSNTHAVFQGLPFSDTKRSFRIEEIPGVLEAGWVPSASGAGAGGAMGDHDEDEVGEDGMPLMELVARLGAVLKGVKALKDSWPFAKPVDASVVNDYYQVITEPMDLGEMTRRINSRFYRSCAQFDKDMMLVVDNCRIYNSPLTTYYRCADTVEAAYRKLMAELFPSSAAAAAAAAADAASEAGPGVAPARAGLAQAQAQAQGQRGGVVTPGVVVVEDE